MFCIAWVVVALAVSVRAEAQFGGPFGLAVNSKDVVYVADIDRACVVKLSSDGRPLGEIHDIPGYGPLIGPFDVQIGPADSIYIADTHAHRIVALDANEKLRFVLGKETKGAAPGEFGEPHFIAITPHGEILVADTFNARIQKFSKDGQFLDAWGKVGDGPGEFLHHGYVARLDVDRHGNVYVREFDGGRIQKYTAEGKHLATFAERGNGPGQLDEGYGLKIIDDKLYCPDTFESRIQIFSLDGKLLEIWAPGEGNDGAHFNHPVGIAQTSKGELIVSDWKNKRLVRLDKTGKFLGSIGRSTAELLLWKPPQVYTRPSRGPLKFAIYAGTDEKTIASAKAAGIDVLYPSFEYQYREWAGLADAVASAAKANIQIHPSIACFSFGQGVANSDVFERHPEWCVWKRGASEPMKILLGWSSPGARSFRADHIVAEVKRSGVQGVMLDYIRYLGTDYGYDPIAIEGFQQKYGIDPTTLPQDDPRWMQFRADYVTQFIAELRHKLAVEIPDRSVQISVYLSGDDPDRNVYLKSSLQDWVTWGRMGIIDTVQVAHYTRDFDRIFDAVSTVRKALPDRIRINAFIAPYGGNLNTPELLAKGVEAAKSAGADEITIYRGDAIDELNLWPAIGEIVKRER